MVKRKGKPVSELIGFLLTLRYNEIRGRMGGQIKGRMDLSLEGPLL